MARLAARPTLGNLAALSEVDSTTIAGGSIITSKLAANAVDASKASFGDLDAVAASIGGWTITSSRLYNGDVSLYSSNGGRIEAGGSSNVVGMTGDGTVAVALRYGPAGFSRAATRHRSASRGMAM